MQRPHLAPRALTAGLLAVAVLTLAACAPFTATPPPGAQASPAATSARPTTAPVATAPTGATPTQTALFAGIVKHAGQPVPNARVELRGLGWTVNKTPAVATVQADSQGAFSLADPPLGDFSVIGYFPDGEMDADGWPPVSLKAGQPVQGFIVPIERKIVLLSPIADSVAPATPTLKWQPAAEAAEYRVWIIDAGTTEVKLDATSRETTLTGQTTLPPGVYQWVVNGLDANGQLVATSQETFIVKATDNETPTAGSQPAPAPGVTESAGPITNPGNMPRLADNERAFAQAREELARKLGIDELAIKRIDMTAQEWNDACMGINVAGQMCAQVITPGWLIIMEAGGKQYEAHTDQQGNRVRFVGLK